MPEINQLEEINNRLHTAKEKNKEFGDRTIYGKLFKMIPDVLLCPNEIAQNKGEQIYVCN